MNRFATFFFALALAFAGQAAAQTTVEYIHADALGSVATVTDANRNVIDRREFAPYGDQLNAPAADRGPGYTGHVEDGLTGLTYMQQRYYDPAIGRFLSVDPVGPLGNPINHFGRYHYANNNPYRFTDPDGRVAIVTHQKDGSVRIQFPSRFTGPAATSENIAAAREHVAGMSGTYTVNGRETSVQVEVTDIKEGWGGTPRAARNEIKLVNGPTSSDSGRSFAELGGKRSEIDVTDRFQPDGVVPHEFAHLGGVDDLYDKTTGLPDPAKGEVMMNTVPAKTDSATIEGIINADSNIRRNER